MFENIKNIFKRNKKREMLKSSSKDTAKERLHLVLMQDRANVSADFLDLMRKEIIEVIKKYIDIDEEAMDVRLTTETNEDGLQGAPALYANIPIINIKDETRKLSKTNQEQKIQVEPPKIKEEEQEKAENEVKKIKKEDNTIKEEVKGEKKEKSKEDTKESKNEIKKETQSSIEKKSKEKVSVEKVQVSGEKKSTNEIKEEKVKNKKEVKEVKEEKKK